MTYDIAHLSDDHDALVTAIDAAAVRLLHDTHDRSYMDHFTAALIKIEFAAEHRPVRRSGPATPLTSAAVEQRRWMRRLVVNFLCGAAFLVALFASGSAWFIVGVLVGWPLSGVVTLIHLAMSSDDNGAEAGTVPALSLRPRGQADAVRERAAA